MNPDAFKLLTSIVIKGRKLLGSVDSQRLLHDRAYAAGVFQKIDQEGDEDLIMTSLQLRSLLGTLQDEEKPKKPNATADAADKYMLGARS